MVKQTELVQLAKQEATPESAKGGMGICSEHQLPTLEELERQSFKVTPDMNSNQVDSLPGQADSTHYKTTQGTGSIEPGQLENPKDSHSSRLSTWGSRGS